MQLINFLVFTLKVLALIFLIVALFDIIVEGLIIAPIERLIIRSKRVKLLDTVRESIEKADTKETEK